MRIRFTYDGHPVILHGNSRLAKVLGVLGITFGSHVFLRQSLEDVPSPLVGRTSAA